MIELIKMGDEFPEQYNVKYNGKMIGYIRVRWGMLSVFCPDALDELVYDKIIEGFGSFTDQERMSELKISLEKIVEWAKYQNIIPETFEYSFLNVIYKEYIF